MTGLPKKNSNYVSEINSIKDCKLKENAHQIVMGDGNINGNLMIIGEGPGQKEDELGKPAFIDG